MRLSCEVYYGSWLVIRQKLVQQWTIAYIAVNEVVPQIPGK